MIGPGVDTLGLSVSEREILDAVLLVLVFSLAIRDLIIMQLSRYRTTYIEIEGQVIRVKYRHMSGKLWMETKGLLKSQSRPRVVIIGPRSPGPGKPFRRL